MTIFRIINFEFWVYVQLSAGFYDFIVERHMLTYLILIDEPLIPSAGD